MMKSIFYSFTIVALIISTLGCEAEFGSNKRNLPTTLPPTDPPPENDSPENPPKPPGSTTACYLKTCFVTTPHSQIVNSNGDYNYPNPNDFANPSLRPQYVAPFFYLDLSKINAKTYLSQNFQAGEFMATYKGRYALFASDVLTHLQQMREYLARAIRITSGYRSPGYNSRLSGSAKWSRHTYGDAVDFSVPGLKIADLTAVCNRYNASFTLTYEKHIHCDWRRQKLDPAFYGPGRDLPQPDKDTLSPADFLAQNSRVDVQTTQENRVFTVDVPFAEDEAEGTPTHVWRVTLPTGEIVSSNDTSITVPTLAGEHRVQVTIGGSIEVETLFVW